MNKSITGEFSAVCHIFHMVKVQDQHENETPTRSLGPCARSEYLPAERPRGARLQFILLLCFQNLKQTGRILFAPTSSIVTQCRYYELKKEGVSSTLQPHNQT